MMNRRAHQVLLPADSIVSTLECLGLCHGDDVFAVRLACGPLSVCGMQGHSLTLAILLVLAVMGILDGLLAILAILSALLRALPVAVCRCRLLPKDFLLEGRDVLPVLLRLVAYDETLGLIYRRHEADGLLLHLRPVLLRGKHAVEKLRVLAELAERVLRCLLLALLLRIAACVATLHVLQHHDEVEDGGSLLAGLIAQQLEVELHPVLLTPFDELRLEVDLLVGEFVDIDHLAQDLALHEAHAGVVALVEIDSTDEGFESVARHVAVVAGLVAAGEDQLVDTHLLGQVVEGLALHEFGARGSEKSLPLTREVAKHNIAYYRIEDGVTEKLQPLVVHGLSLLVAPRDAAMEQRDLVVFDMMGPDAGDPMERQEKLLVLAERELNPVNQIIQHTS